MHLLPQESRKADVVVIGAGGAGQRAALAARSEGVDALLVTKGLVGRSGNTPMGRFSFCVTQDRPGNTRSAHVRDTLDSGEGLSDERLVASFVAHAPQRVRDLLAWRMRFEKRGGQLHQVRVPGHSEARALHFKQETGLEVTRTLRREVTRAGIPLMEDAAVVAIVVEDNAVVGVIAVDVWSGIPVRIEAPAVVVAAGGAGCLYRHNSNAKDSTGDAYALAYRAGAELIDMEMTQFLPFGLVAPASLRGCTDPGGALITAGASLLNACGERFMERYDAKRLEFSTRAIITRAIAEEIRAGRGSPAGGVWLQLPKERGVASEVIEKSWCEYMRQGGVDPDSGRIEVAPSCHYMMGGIRVDAAAAGSVEGLFAAGEAMGGLHGANRLAGHGLVEGQVFGTLAGLSAAQVAKAKQQHSPSPPRRRFVEQWDCFRERIGVGASPTQPWEIKEELASVMTEGAAYVRTDEGMRTALEKVKDLEVELREMKLPAPGLALQEAIEARNLLTTAKVVIRAALHRKETRGAHMRSDYPGRDDAKFKVHIAVSRARDGVMDVAERPVL
ncbi:MAG TPA: FAD-binding protein [Burkholderiales bacterium]|nr:FAD-binding protein [Burkholderiales bacterium]